MGDTERRRRRVRPPHGRPGPAEEPDAGETAVTAVTAGSAEPESAQAERAGTDERAQTDERAESVVAATVAAQTPPGPSPATLAERGGPTARVEQPRDRGPARTDQARDRGSARTDRPDQPRGRGPGEEGERGLRGLVGSGSSQVSVTAAMRARDAARPSDEQVADAEANLPIVRRNWTPREELPRNR